MKGECTMSFAGRLRFFRNKEGLTQKLLGQLMGFPEKSADIRVAQYENESRVPKPEVVDEFAKRFAISPRALAVPDITSYDGLMHTLFALEDTFGLRMEIIDGEPYFRIDDHGNYDAFRLKQGIMRWKTMVELLDAKEITRSEYDYWRYNYAEDSDVDVLPFIGLQLSNGKLVKAYRYTEGMEEEENT